MNWLEASAAWDKRRRRRIYQIMIPSENQVIMFCGAIGIHVIFNLLGYLAANL